MESLLARLERLEKIAVVEKTKQDVKETEVVKLNLKRSDKEEEVLLLSKVTELFKSLGGQSQEELLSKVEKFVSYGLSTIFGEDYQFVAELNVEGKDLKVEFYVRTRDLATSVTTAKGGGVAEVVSILLQLFFVVALGDKFAPFVLMDTAMLHISPEYHAKVSALLKELSDKLNLQIVLIANVNEYGAYADKVYRFNQVGGHTRVEEEK